jgi:hypothetical protein
LHRILRDMANSRGWLILLFGLLSELPFLLRDLRSIQHRASFRQEDTSIGIGFLLKNDSSYPVSQVRVRKWTRRR